MELGLQGKSVLVTGAAGGIGSAIVRAFVSEGARVALHYRSSEERAKALASETGALPVQGDLTIEADVESVFSTVLDELGRIDVLIANAGYWPSEDVPVWELPYERWRQTIAVDLDSVFLCCREFLKHVADTGTGNIVLISSTAGIFGEAGHADYAAAKSAVAGGLLKSLKNEIVRIAPNGRVNAVCPGWTATDMTRAELQDPSLVERITKTMALNKVGTADEVARVVVTLASDEVSGHLTGEAITVAGGMEGRILR
jgi:3-oxoacyl-[acyl-carrier protein] reductase